MRVGDVVLKSIDDEVDATWTAALCHRVVAESIRVVRPVRATDGAWVVDGWTATTYVSGLEPVGDRWSELIAAGRAFHAAVADEARPAHLDDRADWWSKADRAVWGEESVDLVDPAAAIAGRLRDAMRPADLRSQVVHGDLGGNVLFGDGPPLVLDVSVYWRPPAWAEALALVDGIMWAGAPSDVLDLLDRATALQVGVRALLFRVTSDGQATRPDALAHDWPRSSAMAEMLLSRGW